MAPRRLPQAIEVINENLDKEETVASTAIAALVQMSYSHFSLNCTSSGQTSCYRKQILPVADIALRTGFASQSQFTTIFRRLPGRRQKVLGIRCRPSSR